MACDTSSGLPHITLLMGLMAARSTYSKYKCNLTAYGSTCQLAVCAHTYPLLQNSAVTWSWVGFCLRGVTASQDIFSHQIITRVISCILNFPHKEEARKKGGHWFCFCFLSLPRQDSFFPKSRLLLIKLLVF